MNTVKQSLDDLSRGLRERPDEIMLEIGAGGELLVARIRIVAVSLLLLLPITNLLLGGSFYESMSGAAGTIGAFLLSLLWLQLSKHHRMYRWLPFVSAACDVSAVSVVLLLLSLQNPSAGLNSVVVWSCYPLAIMATALRNDVRVCLLSGALAIVQFSLLSIFIMQQGGTVASIDYGIVSVSNQVQRVLLLIAISMLAAVIVYRMQLLVLLSGTDGLTGLPNRLYLNHRVPHLLQQAKTDNATLSIAIIDMDLFKRINDDLGHIVGDRALRHVVQTFREQLDAEEPLIRIGGEEFLLVMRMPIGNAWERIEFLRKQLNANPFLLHPDSAPRALSFSAGLACCPHDASDISGLLKHADRRLRAAKLQGRNRVIARD
ncbi:MAG: GGDEF domain-containing protein [Arenimonas sp.]